LVKPQFEPLIPGHADFELEVVIGCPVIGAESFCRTVAGEVSVSGAGGNMQATDKGRIGLQASLRIDGAKSCAGYSVAERFESPTGKRFICSS
jgi:hypothetical protein